MGSTSIFTGILAGSIFIGSNKLVNSDSTPKYYFFMITVLGLSMLLSPSKNQLSLPVLSQSAKWLAIVSLGLVITYILLSNTSNIVPIFSIIAFGLFGLQIKYLDKTKQVLITIFFIGIVLAVYGLLQYVEWLPSNHSKFIMTGPFDNPAGFAATLALIFPIGLLLLLTEDNRSSLRWFFSISLFLLSLSVVLSGSRTGILSIVASSGILLVLQTNLITPIKKIPHWKIIVPAIFLTVLAVSVAILYTMNIDSANGRLLIWRVSSEMIADKPLFGHGQGAFLADYMDYQADYFVRHPESRFGQLAGNVKHPFNEFVLIAVEYGLVGLLIVVLSCFFIVRNMVVSTDEHSDLSISGCVAFFIIALFSYPLQYISVWILVIFYAALTIEVKQLELKNSFYTVLGKAAVVILSMGCLVWTFKNIRAEIEWNKIARSSLAGQTKQMLPRYKELYPVLRDHPYFLYNYGAELNVAGKYNESIAILDECKKRFNDYDLQLLLADNYQRNGNLDKAEIIYQHAAHMIPARFWPLYQLVELYKKQGKNGKAVTLANQIVHKKVKVPSATVSSIKFEMEKFVEKLNTEY